VKVAVKSAAFLLARDDDALLQQQISGEAPLTVPAPRAFRSAWPMAAWSWRNARQAELYVYAPACFS